MGKKKEENTRLLRQIASLEQERDVLLGEAADIVADCNRVNDARVEELEKENRALHDSYTVNVAFWKGHAQIKDEANMEARTELAHSRAETVKARAELAQARTEVKRLASAIEGALDKHTATAVLKQRVAELKAELSTMRAAHPEDSCYAPDAPWPTILRARISAAVKLLEGNIETMRADCEDADWLQHIIDTLRGEATE